MHTVEQRSAAYCLIIGMSDHHRNRPAVEDLAAADFR
jgi:hypothetical protein